MASATSGVLRLGKGHARQHVNLLGYALMLNSLSLLTYGRSRDPTLPTVA